MTRNLERKDRTNRQIQNRQIDTQDQFRNLKMKTDNTPVIKSKGSNIHNNDYGDNHREM